MSCLLDGITAWDNIAVSPTVREWIIQGVPLILKEIGVAPSFYLHNQRFNKEEFNFIQNELQSLLQSGAIEKCNYRPLCVSPLICVPKKTGGFRLVTNLFELNKYIHAPKFQYENIGSVSDVIEPQDHMVTLDLKNGFFHVKVAKGYRDYLGFQFQGLFYRWSVCPFGLNSSPYYFNKILRSVTAFLRENGIRHILYVDDILILAQPANIVDHRDFVLQTFEELGFSINYEKCCLDPGSRCSFIGYIIDSNGPDNLPWLFMQPGKIKKLKKDIKRCLLKGRVQARCLAKICGQAIAMSKAVLPGKLKLRFIYALLATKSSWSDILYLTPRAEEQLNWWLVHLDDWNGSPLLQKHVEAQVWTDSSDTGWGCVLNDKDGSGTWDSDIACEHINFKELLTILYALICFQDDLRNKTVRFFCDNTTAVAYVRNMGGPIAKLSELAESIWAFALKNNILLQVLHVPGLDNCHADRLSRLSQQYEWQLNPALFGYIDRLWGPHTVDRFASLATAQLPVYNSRYLDPMTAGVDALSQPNWGKENNYVNAPFRLLNRVIQTIVHHKAYATVIAPYWPNQSWCQKLINLLISPPLRIKISRWTILQAGHLAEPLKNKRWKLYAWRVYGGKNSLV